MDYLLIIILQLLGIGFHVGQKIYELDKKSPDDTLNQVMAMFWKEDRITVFISCLIIVLNLVAHYIIGVYAKDLVAGIKYYDLYSFAIALTLGYAGQKLVYKYLGKLEEAIANKADKIK